jgi:hypothetical protein
VLLLLFACAALPAQEEPPAEPEADAPIELTPEERAAIEKAIDADAPPAASMPNLSKVNLAQALPATVQSMNPDISIILDVAAAWFSDTPDQRGGHDPNQTGFNLQQLEMSIGASVDPFLRFDSNIVFTLFGVEIEEAYATTLALPANLQVRAGQFLTRFGRINATHPHAWHFVDQPLVNGKFFGGEGNRGIGGELSWLAPLPWYVEAGAAVTGATGDCCARSYLGADDIGVKTPLDLLGTFTLKQFFPLTDDWSFFFGMSAQTGPNASGNLNRTEIYGVDAMLRLRPPMSDVRWSLNLEVEAMLRGRQVPFAVLYDAGGYAQVVWEIDPQWESGVRYEIVTGVASDPLDPQWSDARHRGALQLTYYPSHFSRLRLQSSVDAPTWANATPVLAVFATLEVLVGAHGSHDY